MAEALQLNPRDNVAVVLSNVRGGEEVKVIGRETLKLTAKEDIPFGHKIALLFLEANGAIIKYGEEIGKARIPILPGSWVHLHNVYCERGKKVL
ncbi:MAG: UxaA family hydrolase [Moorella sp. (in: firmicutes)]